MRMSASKNLLTALGSIVCRTSESLSYKEGKSLCYRGEILWENLLQYRIDGNTIVKAF